MVFSSPTFLFLFLPIVLALYYVAPMRVRNGLLLAASLYFYAWGDIGFVPVMLASIGMNYGFGRWLERHPNGWTARTILTCAVVGNLALLGYCKYMGFALENLNLLLAWCDLPTLEYRPVRLPLGISFFTFQAMSYVIDVYRRESPAQRNPLHLALYIAMFPQLIAGPIVRYGDIAAQIVQRTVTRAGFVDGIRRFIFGLGKKALIANTVAIAADAIFLESPDKLTMPVAWLGIFCYSLQIYYDFSGYSDMAIGLGQMFGFRFAENFRYPYVATSITDFWRRWHISLSTWYRDYLYIPLGGNRVAPWRVYLNLLTVFLLCGLWHGASWNFVIWGMLHGALLMGERLARHWDRPLPPVLLRHAWVLLMVMVGWVFFRAETLPQALGYLAVMAGRGTGSGLETHLGMYLTNGLVLAMLVGVIAATPVLPAINRLLDRLADSPRRAASAWLEGVQAMCGACGPALVLFASVVVLSAETYNPFIYFRF